MTGQDPIESAGRVLDIVEALKAEQPLGVTELAEQVGMPKSTVHVHLSTLKSRGYVVQNKDKAYQLSLRFLDIGMKVRERQEMYQEVTPKLSEIADETDEKAWWIVEENGKAVFLAKALGSRAIQTNSQIGQYTELYRLAGGMAILSVLPKRRRETILESYDYPLPDGRDRQELEAELNEIQDRGVAYGIDQFLEGVAGVGAPLVDNAGNTYGAISVSGPANRLDSERIENELTDLIRGISGELQVNLSYQ
ncbi:transcriptional regulator [Haloarcula rubripromontorii]|uniref:Transcriptional regulator n=1 Tax=Haloarcula rubripromontorii TaxID=1705562 RepID=A0A0M9AN74_9EURY|nr:IclR family transcriptional regulator [Haloarcula rubripromontorii]KOX94091.1 transcriptional regulator [Haloarcula rubripromontorii]